MSEYASTSSRPTSPVGDLPQLSNTARPYRFNWDAAHRKPGPGSVSETTEGRGDYFATAGQTPYDVLTPNATLTLGTFPAEWSSSIHGFHAISTVVNSPHKKSAPPKAHSALPAVPAAELPRVRRKDFDSYLHSVAPEWERLEKNAEQGREGVAQISNHVPPTERSSSSVDIPTSPRTPRPHAGKPLPSLATVPEIYFEKNFNLGDPRTFNVVTEFSDQHEGFMLDDPASFTYAQPLIDKLSGYADTIEQHLVREISERSTSFFAALANLQDLQSESEQCLGRIKQLRGLLKEVDEKSAVKGLEVVRLEGRMRNLGKVRQAIGVVGSVVEMVGIAKSLVGAGQWGEALDVVDGLDALWDSGVQHPVSIKGAPVSSISSKDGRRSPPLATVEESPPSTPPVQHTPPSTSKLPAPSIPVSSLHAFTSLPSNLRTLTTQIAASLTSEIIGVLKLDLVDRIDHGSSVLDGLPSLNGYKEGTEGKMPNGGMQMSLKDKLRPLLHSLVRTGGVRQATASWREVALAEVKGVLKRHAPLFSLDDDDATSQSSELTAMEQPKFLDLARIMYEHFLNCIEGLQAQNNLIVEVLEGIRQSKPLDVSALKGELMDILSSAGEGANTLAAKVLGYRSEQHTALELKDFWTFFNLSWDFVVKSEVICRRMIVGLRGVVVSQSKTFIQAFHQTRLSQSAKLVEDEQWGPAEVPPLTQHIVNLLVDASIRDPPEFSFNPSSLPSVSPMSPGSALSPTSPSVNGIAVIIQPSSPIPSPAFPPSNNRLHAPEGAPRRRSAQSSPGKHLKIEDRNFFAVQATLDVLVLLSDYLRVIVNLPTLVTETMSRVIELLKAFNSRTCQVVLGAGAMRSAGLKNITAKHLALASQSLSIMISLIPYVRETFRRHLSAKQAVILVEFDKLKRDYQEHQNEIHAKLIAIMSDRLSAHIRSLQAVDWSTLKPGGGANEYMELLAKETTTLHKVLSRYLSLSVVEYVMTQVFAAINHRLSEEYANLELPSLEAKERLLVDARYLHEKLSGLKNVRAPTAMLEIVIQEKRVNLPPPQSPQPAMQSTPPPPPVSSPLPPSSTTLKFAHMFSRVAPSRAATTPVLASAPAPAAASSPTPDPEAAKFAAASPTPDVEKTLPILSPPAESAKSPGLVNGHASPQSESEPTQSVELELSRAESDAARRGELEPNADAEAEAEPDVEPEPEVEVEAEVLTAEPEHIDAVAESDAPSSVDEAPPTPPKDDPQLEKALANGVNGDVSVVDDDVLAADDDGLAVGDDAAAEGNEGDVQQEETEAQGDAMIATSSVTV